jgi:predicted enzyme related to lactoylglutathione lyase
MSLNHGAIWWSELLTNDVDGAVRYYGDTCGWAFDSMPMGDSEYRIAIAHGKPVAGIMDSATADDMGCEPPCWFTYIAVDDVAASVAATQAAGGEVLRTPYDVPQVGRIAIVRDPGGAPLGLMTPVFPLDDVVIADQAAQVYYDDDVDDDENFPV